MKKKILLVVILVILCCILILGVSIVCKKKETQEIKATIIDANGNTVEMTYQELANEKSFNEDKFYKDYNGATISFEDSVTSVEENYRLKVSNLRDYQVSTSNIYKTDGVYITGYLIKFNEGWSLFVGKNGEYSNLIEGLSSGDKLSVKSKLTMLSSNSGIVLYSIIEPCEEHWNERTWVVSYTCNYDYENLEIEKK